MSDEITFTVSDVIQTTGGGAGTLASLTDVDTEGVTDGQVLKYEAASDTWKPGTVAAGADGNTVLYGAGAPAAGLGIDGNFYIDTSVHFIYGPKSAGAWPAGTSLAGPKGDQGVPGNDGTDGSDGAAGRSIQVFEQSDEPTGGNYYPGDLWIQPA